MKTILPTIVLLLSLNVQAAPFRLNVSVAEQCLENSEVVLLQLEPVIPPEFTFMAGGTPDLLPLAIETKINGQFNAFGASNKAVRVTNANGQFFSLQEEKLSHKLGAIEIFNKNAKILVQTHKNVLCNNENEIAFVFAVKSGENTFGNIKYILSTNQAKVPPATRLEMLKAINALHLEKLVYYLSDQFLWFEEENNQLLADFFYQVEPQYLLRDHEVESVLTNPKYDAQVLADGTLRVSFGQNSSLDLNTKAVWNKPMQVTVTKIINQGKTTLDLKKEVIKAPPQIIIGDDVFKVKLPSKKDLLWKTK